MVIASCFHLPFLCGFIADPDKDYSWKKRRDTEKDREKRKRKRECVSHPPILCVNSTRRSPYKITYLIYCILFLSNISAITNVFSFLFVCTTRHLQREAHIRWRENWDTRLQDFSLILKWLIYCRPAIQHQSYHKTLGCWDKYFH